ncbi:MAG: cofactor-independent phosphoglycerate mutase [Tannerella sp.]|jgi:2,3-bisphosphoglycerate-independent phosphoglycerate mutase|nr:cofactor-independent phosphoglycerate mutase [Tannerella sp.]
MKRILILGDGMADEPIDMLGGRTPLQYARTPFMDELARRGATGRLQTVPDGFAPGSEVANLAVLGYDLTEVYEGRGVLEAASMNVELHPGELAMRCNLVCLEGERLRNHSAGHITSEEAGELIAFLNEMTDDARIRFHAGVSYRHLLVMQGGDKRLACTPPHDIPMQPFRPALMKATDAAAAETAALLNRLTAQSQEWLSAHPVNQKRMAAGKDPANSVWFWSPGYRPAMRTLKELYGIPTSAVISAVDLIRGIGVYAGMDVVTVEGATGLYNTNYEGKAQAAIEALRTHDFVYVHVEASDEAGHEGDVRLKVRTVEDLDRRVIGPVYETVRQWDEPVAIAVLPDHPTPCAVRTHTKDPVPFLIYTPGQTPDAVACYDEFSVRQGKYGLLTGDRFIREFTAKE